MNNLISFPKYPSFVRLWIPVVCAIFCLTRTATCDTMLSLTDKTFEHRTQAASGQTTGTWFVMFSTNDGSPAGCPKCKYAEAQWRLIAEEQIHRSPLQFAQVMADGPSGSEKLLKRFGVKYLPYYILFRDRKMFRLPSGEQNESDLLEFAHDRYHGVYAEVVPSPLSYIDITRQNVFDYTYTNSAKVGAAIAIIFGTIPIICVLFRKKKEKRI